MNRKVVPVFNFCRPARHNELCRPAPHNELVVVYLLRRNATCHFKKSWPSMNQDARTRNRNLVGVLRTTEHKQGSRISSNARAAVINLLSHFFDFSRFFFVWYIIRTYARTLFPTSHHVGTTSNFEVAVREFWGHAGISAAAPRRAHQLLNGHIIQSLLFGGNWLQCRTTQYFRGGRR